MKTSLSPIVVVIVLAIMMSLIPSHNRLSYGQIDRVKQDAIVSCNCVAFRLDDIQDFFLTNAQMEVIKTFEQKNASLTVGIIGNHFGDYIVMQFFLKEKIASNSNNHTGFSIEIANHGWNHEDFTIFSREEQSVLIEQSNKKIIDTLNVRPVVFIPPYNSPNNDTVAALLENDFHYMSANTTRYPPSFLRAYHNMAGSDAITGAAVPDSKTIFHFPSAANTGDLNADNTEWIGKSHDETFRAINASMNELGYAIVTMHPMEFSLRNGTVYENEIDHAQIRELELMIDDIRAAGFKIVTISQIDDGYGSAIPEFSSFSSYAILAGSIVLAIWISNKRNLSFSRDHSNRSNNKRG